MTGNPLSSSTTVSSPLQHIKRKFQSGKTEAYDLVKVKTNQTHRYTLILLAFNN